MPGPIPFDAVLFDLDGTLVATDRFWPVAADRGCREALADLGLDRAPPSPEEWLSMVGLPLEVGFDRVFGDLAATERRVVQERVVASEHAALAAGGAALYASVPAVLERLRAAGCRLGIASNCSADYLAAMLDETNAVGLARWIDEARCLDSPGIATKADMVADLLDTFETRSAVMIGDRDGDREAAHRNGLPHVHLRHGFATADETVHCEAVLDSIAALPDRLEARNRWIEGVLTRLGGPPAGVIGIAGGPLAGKRLFARDAARLLERRGRSADVLELEVDAGALCGADGPARADEAARAIEERAAGAGPLFVVGAAALHPRVATRLDRALWLAVDDEVALRRALGRDRTVVAAERVRDELERVAELRRRWPPERVLDLVVPAENPLGADG